MAIRRTVSCLAADVSLVSWWWLMKKAVYPARESQHAALWWWLMKMSRCISRASGRLRIPGRIVSGGRSWDAIAAYRVDLPFPGSSLCLPLPQSYTFVSIEPSLVCCWGGAGWLDDAWTRRYIGGKFNVDGRRVNKRFKRRFGKSRSHAAFCRVAPGRPWPDPDPALGARATTGQGQGQHQADPALEGQQKHAGPGPARPVDSLGTTTGHTRRA
jgi:hypothetical protein